MRALQGDWAGVRLVTHCATCHEHAIEAPLCDRCWDLVGPQYRAAVARLEPGERLYAVDRARRGRWRWRDRDKRRDALEREAVLAAWLARVAPLLRYERTMQPPPQPPWRVEGRPVCRWCWQPCPPGRRAWCSDACLYDYTTRARPLWRYDELMDRQGVRCAGCGLSFGRFYRWARAADSEHDRTRRRGYSCARDCRCGGCVARRTYPHYLRDQSYAEVDHVIPVAHGGGCCDLDGLQVLCRGCHASKTAEQARLRAAPTLPLPLWGTGVARGDPAHVAGGPNILRDLGQIGGG